MVTRGKRKQPIDFLQKVSTLKFLTMGSSVSKGGAWTGLIYFDPEADISSNVEEISAFELRSRLRNEIDASEEILNIWIYKEPIWNWEWTYIVFFHVFVVLETNKFWWSLEKRADGIVFQRSKLRSSVVEKICLEPLSPYSNKPQEIISDEGRMTISNLMDFLYSKKVLEKHYNFIGANCKDFAKLIFDEVGTTFLRNSSGPGPRAWDRSQGVSGRSQWNGSSGPRSQSI